MTVIEVFSSSNKYLAAAVMAKTLGQASEPQKDLGQPRKRVKAEKTRPRNPNRLTVDQHVFPVKSIERFANEDERVSVHDLYRNKIIRVKPGNPIFCASRAWDQRAESGYMKQIEDSFQNVVGSIVDEKTQIIAPEFRVAVDEMYALWYMRSRHRKLESQEVQLNEISGDDLTQEQEENLEKNGYMFARKNGTMPARQLNGIELQMRVYNYARDLAGSVSRWGVILAQSGEFIVPDVSVHGIIPLTPRLALVQSTPDGMITEQNLAQINSAMRAMSHDYLFARDFSSCPFL